MSRARLPLAALSLASVLALVLAGCAQSTDASKDTGDTAASAEFRKHLARVLTKRALAEALA